jgi:hypothetical protein
VGLLVSAEHGKGYVDLTRSRCRFACEKHVVVMDSKISHDFIMFVVYILKCLA